MIVVYIVVGIVAILFVVFVIVPIFTAPEAYEDDEKGFCLGKPPLDRLEQGHIHF